MARATQAIIHLDALTHNYSLAKTTAHGARTYGVIKANAYGHGLCEVAHHLARQADALAVACVDEAQQLRQSGIHIPILVLQGPYNKAELALCAELNLEVVVQNQEQAQWTQALTSPMKVWLKVDTGMHRLGLPPDEAHSVLAALQESAVKHDIGMMSHFACADEQNHPFNQTQQQVFAEFQKLGLSWCFCNSAAILSLPACHGHAIRPGIMMYGASPFDDRSSESLGLKPAMTLRTEIQTMRFVPEGEAIGYGCNWRAQRLTKLAVVAIGYGDGYPRQAPSGTPVLVNGHKVPVVGRVSMDMITIDVTDIENVKAGDEVILWGPGLPAEEVARHCQTIAYELFCQVGIRVPRIYQ